MKEQGAKNASSYRKSEQRVVYSRTSDLVIGKSLAFHSPEFFFWALVKKAKNLMVSTRARKLKICKELSRVVNYNFFGFKKIISPAVRRQSGVGPS